MVSDEHKCIFVHLRRTGGNSIELALGGIVLLDKNGEKTSTWDNNLHRGHNVPHKLDYRGHYMHDTAMAIKKQYPARFEKFVKFSIVRNPWDQMISLYLRLNAQDPEAVNFKQFLNTYNVPAGTVPEYSLFDEQGICMMDEIGRFENLTDDYIKICSNLGIDSDPLSNTNSSSKKHYSEYYDSESEDLVSRLFCKDISYFGYKFAKS
jgi:chondroitin 4-sulfotransferase 11